MFVDMKSSNGEQGAYGDGAGTAVAWFGTDAGCGLPRRAGRCRWACAGHLQDQVLVTVRASAQRSAGWTCQCAAASGVTPDGWTTQCRNRMQCRCHGGPEEEQGLVVLVELVLNHDGVVDVVDTVVVAAVVLAVPAVVAQELLELQ